MLGFHVQSVALFVALVAISAGSSFTLYRQSLLTDLLLPREQSAFSWQVTPDTDSSIGGGSSTLVINDAAATFDFDFLIKDAIPFPYVTYGVNFTEYSRPLALANWSRYEHLKLKVKCTPANVLALSVQTYDDEITKVEDFATYRKSETFFSCNEDAREVILDLTRLETPEWWLRYNDLAYSKRSYYLSKVQGFSLHNSPQSPRDVLSNVRVTSASLHGKDLRYVCAAVVLNFVIWGLFTYWYLKEKTASLIAEITEKILQERPLVAYQQLPDDTKQDREKNTVLRYMATHYANQDLNLDTAVAELGINRAKINAFLKDELGLTFSAYINKLRLTEASRLLLQKESSVAEIAYMVGYSNASYFTTVFKKEYGCTPGDFRKLMVDKAPV